MFRFLPRSQKELFQKSFWVTLVAVAAVHAGAAVIPPSDCANCDAELQQYLLDKDGNPLDSAGNNNTANLTQVSSNLFNFFNIGASSGSQPRVQLAPTLIPAGAQVPQPQINYGWDPATGKYNSFPDSVTALWNAGIRPTFTTSCGVSSGYPSFVICPDQNNQVNPLLAQLANDNGPVNPIQPLIPVAQAPQTSTASALGPWGTPSSALLN
jgi:hypothetical protein